MFCKNCGQELSSIAKFCPVCGTAVIEDEPEIQFTALEKSKEVKDSIKNLEEQQSNDTSGTSIESEETTNHTVSEQLNTIPEKQKQTSNEANNITNDLQQPITSNNMNSASEEESSKISKEDVKGVLLPQKGKKFKDLPKKQKILRLGIGGTLLLVAVIWFVFDGISGAKKAGDPDKSARSGNTVDVISSQCDTGAVFDMTLDEFSDLFNETLYKTIKELSPDAQITKSWDLKDYWGNRVEPQITYEENSGKQLTVHSAFFEGTHIIVTLIDGKVHAVRVCFKYENNDLAKEYGGIVYTIFSGLDFEDAINKIFDPVRNGMMNNTMIYKDSALFYIEVETLSFSVMAAAQPFVDSLINAKDAENPPHVILFGEDSIINDDYEKDNNISINSKENNEAEQQTTSQLETSQNDTGLTKSANIYVVNTKSDDLRIRESADLNSKVIGSIPKGTKVIATDEENGFLLVKYNDITGWASKDYLIEYTGESSTTSKQNNSVNSSNNQNKGNQSQTKTNEEIAKDIAEDVVDYAVDKGVDVAKDVIRSVF